MWQCQWPNFGFLYKRLRYCPHEPQHEKTNKVAAHPAKTQISLGIRPVWPESSLSTRRTPGSLATYWAHCEDWSDWADAQTDLSLHWARLHVAGFVTSWVISFCVILTSFLTFYSQENNNLFLFWSLYKIVYWHSVRKQQRSGLHFLKFIMFTPVADKWDHIDILNDLRNLTRFVFL